MKGEWIFIRKNDSNVAAYKRLKNATRAFELVCQRSDPAKDIVEMITESEQLLASF